MKTELYSKDVSLTRFAGRRRIYSDCKEITRDNVVQCVREALAVHDVNAGQIGYLWRYYRGEQPILSRVKDVRPEICNKVVENHAQEIVSFKVGYQLSEPIQYISREDDFGSDHESAEDALSQSVAELNALMYAEGKASLDRDLFEDMCIYGVGYRFANGKDKGEIEDGDAPYCAVTLDPAGTFVVYGSDFRHKPLMGVVVGVDVDTYERYFDVYTDSRVFNIRHDAIVGETGHPLGRVPIVEYDLNNARMGVFEPVLPLLDAINAVESNRLDGIEQTVQSLMKFVNCDVTADDFVELLGLGAVKVKSVDGVQGDVEMLNNDLDQTQTQVTKDDLIQQMCKIVGMPNTMSTGSSTSDTGTAVMLRDGWTQAETHAKSYELQFKKAEREFLRVVLRICKMDAGCTVSLRVRDIDMAFNRRNYENALSRAQVLTTMLAEPQICPELAFQSCGLFTDPQAAYLQSKAHYEQVKKEQQEQFAASQSTVDATQGGTDDTDDSQGQSVVNEQVAAAQRDA